MNLCLNNYTSQNDAIFAQKSIYMADIGPPRSQCLSSYGCTITVLCYVYIRSGHYTSI